VGEREREDGIIWLIFFLFLQTKPSFSPLIAWFQLDFSATLDSVSAVQQNVNSKFVAPKFAW
jgi:hypothetical protein